MRLQNLQQRQQKLAAWNPYVEDFVQVSYDADNNFRYCEARSVELPEDREQRIWTQHFLDAKELISASGETVNINLRNICTDRIEYKIGSTLGDSPHIVSWITCD